MIVFQGAVEQICVCAFYREGSIFSKFCRSPKLQIFIDHNALLTQNRDTHKKLNSKIKMEIWQLEQKL